jgi:ABC-type sugar transport system permease subunit
VTSPAAGQLLTQQRKRLWGRAWPYAYSLPAIAAIGLVFGYSLVVVVIDSFYGGTIGQMVYNGGANYGFVIHDPVFIQSVEDNLRLLVTVPVLTALALAVALLINDQVRGWKAYRATIFFPYLLPPVVIGIVFSYLLQGDGIVNSLLRDAGLSVLAVDWLGSARLAIYTVGGVLMWQQLGFGMVVFTSALLALPPDVTDAARVDGLSWWQIQTRILIPQIRRVIEFFVIFEIITVLAWVFSYVYVLTDGGPANASSVVELYIWKNGFQIGAVGLASAVAVLLLGAISVFILVFLTIRSIRLLRASAR